MVLDGYIEEEQPLLRGFVLKFIDNLLKGGLVADIAMLLGDGNVHILHAFEVVEAQQRVSLIALPGGALARVEGKGAVAVFFEQRSQGGGRLQNVLLVGDAAGRQERHRVAGQKFKFAGAGARTKDRGVAMSTDAVVQRVDEIGDTFAQGKVAEAFKVCPGFVHDGDDVRTGIGGNSRFDRSDLLRNPLDVLCRRVLRRFDRHELGVAQKNSKSAVFGVGAGLVPDIGADTEGFQRVGLQNRIGAGNDGAQIGSPCPQTVLGRTKTPAFHPAAQQQEEQRQ